MSHRIIYHESDCYKRIKIPHNNGAFFYSKEIVENIIPKIKTDRSWILVNIEGKCFDHSIIFIHNNDDPEHYDWIDEFKDLILICSQKKTLLYMIKKHPKCHVIYLPLSIDTKYVKQFKTRKTRKVAFFGRFCKIPKDLLKSVPDIHIIGGMDRDKLLKEVARYKTVYAIDRCALEAKCLGCDVITYDMGYNDLNFELVDNVEAAELLQKKLNEIDI